MKNTIDCAKKDASFNYPRRRNHHYQQYSTDISLCPTAPKPTDQNNLRYKSWRREVSHAGRTQVCVASRLCSRLERGTDRLRGARNHMEPGYSDPLIPESRMEIDKLSPNKQRRSAITRWRPYPGYCLSPPPFQGRVFSSENRDDPAVHVNAFVTRIGYSDQLSGKWAPGKRAVPAPLRIWTEPVNSSGA